MKDALLILASGFEEIEALAPVDILRRAELSVVVASTVEGPVTGRCGVKVVADTTLDNVLGEEFRLIILPGGAKGTENLRGDTRVLELIRRQYSAGRFIAAICAAPTVLKASGIIKGRCVTSHPTVREELKEATLCDERVCVDGNIITSQGPGTALEFAFKLAELLAGKEVVERINRGVLARL